MTTQADEIKFEWELKHLILPSRIWVYSEPFSFEEIANVRFDIGLQMNLNQENLDIQVRKNDSRPATATITIELIKKDPKTVFSASPFHSIATISQKACNNLPIYQILENMVQKNTLFEWRDVCTFNRFSSFTRYDKHLFLVPVVPFECIIKNMIVRGTILWKGFNDPDPGTIVPKTVYQPTMEDRQSPCLFSMQPTFKADLFNDIVIVVDDVELPAHRVILSAHSPYFNAMFTTDMKESKENRVEIKNFTMDVITEMLEYFYSNKTKASEDVDVALKMTPVADMYQIDSLKYICESTLSKNINLDNVLNILCTAFDYNVTDLRKKIINFMIKNKERVVTIPEFKNLCLTKPQMLHEFLLAIIN